jgi:hypothetical protein
MKRVVTWMLKVMGLSLLGLTLIYVIWQPVIPSGFIVQKMAESMKPPDLPQGEQKVLRFDLSGKGGGVYNLVLQRDDIEVVEGYTDQVDLIVFMEAKDFNDLMISLARGKADEFTFRRLIISKVMRFAGDMGVFALLAPNEGAEGQ